MTIEEQWDHPGTGSGSFTSKLDKGTLHSTEGGSIEGAVAAFEAHNSWPHKTVDYHGGRRRVCRHLSFDEAARALRNTSEPGQTNRDGTIQYELVGHAATMLDEYGEQDWIDLGRDVIGPDFRACGIPLECHVTMPTYPPPNGERLGHESTRLSRDQVERVVGILGHCNWPENEHGDPGPLTAKHYRGGTVSAVDLILEGAGAAAKEWTDMASEAQVEAAAKRGAKAGVQEALAEEAKNKTKGSLGYMLRGVYRAVIDAPEPKEGARLNGMQALREQGRQIKARLDELKR